MAEDSDVQVAKILGDWADRLKGAETHLLHYLNFACRQLQKSGADFRYRLAECRVKNPPEVARSLGEQGLGVDDVLLIDDLIGGRVVVLTGSDIETLVEYVERDRQCPLEEIQVEIINDDSGYRATHVKGWVGWDKERFGCEVQIRTAIADAWAVISRADLYRREELPEMLPEFAQIQARHLAVADDALELIRQEANRSAAPQVEAGSPSQGARLDQVIRPEPVRVETTVPSSQVVQTPPEMEVFVQRNPISERLRSAFYESFLADRWKTAATGKVFKRCGAFGRSVEWDEVLQRVSTRLSTRDRLLRARIGFSTIRGRLRWLRKCTC